jgi:hypothetical protein
LVSKTPDPAQGRHRQAARAAAADRLALTLTRV